MRKAAVAVGLVVGLYFIGRAVAEPFVIDMSDPASTGRIGADQAYSACSWSIWDRAWWQLSPSRWP
jgi:hypothetical protein